MTTPIIHSGSSWLSFEQRPEQHNPNKLRSYVDIHTTVLFQAQSAGQIVDWSTLDLDPWLEGGYLITGHVRLAMNPKFRLDVTKTIETVGDLVQTASYSYNFRLEGLSNIFRYDAPHGEATGPGGNHHPYHHKHQYNPFASTDRERERDTIEYSPWPHLGDVISEACEWYWEHETQLRKLDIT